MLLTNNNGGTLVTVRVSNVVDSEFEPSRFKQNVIKWMYAASSLSINQQGISANTFCFEFKIIFSNRVIVIPANYCFSEEYINYISIKICL